MGVNDVFAISLASMQQDMGRVDRVAQNMANVSTPGYKREVFAVRPFTEALAGARLDPKQAAAAGAVSAPELGVAQVVLDVRPGTVKVTGQPLDLALTGDGFFEVATESGPAYTRQGNFQIDARGRLVTAQGHPVMGKGGEIMVGTGTPVIDAAGRMTEPSATTGASGSEPGAILAQLRLVRFEDSGALRHLGGGLLAPDPGVTALPDDITQVRQGALENANVSSTQEMVQLIQTMRHFESMQKVVQGYDELLGTAIRKLGDLS